MAVNKMKFEECMIKSIVNRLCTILPGGRIAVSGQNGWVFFDYLLARFAPQQVPLKPLRLQMAFPPHGCDATQYTVRIKDTAVAILRGGCSIGQ